MYLFLLTVLLLFFYFCGALHGVINVRWRLIQDHKLDEPLTPLVLFLINFGATQLQMLISIDLIGSMTTL